MRRYLLAIPPCLLLVAVLLSSWHLTRYAQDARPKVGKISESDVNNAPDPPILSSQDSELNEQQYRESVASADSTEPSNLLGPQDFDYREILSQTSGDRQYYPIFLDGLAGYNPNLIPHPTKSDLWIMVAQRLQTDHAVSYEQLVCEVGFMDGALLCAEHPTVLPIQPGVLGNCAGDMAIINMAGGSRDARVFYGLDRPYILYGSQSQQVCLGQWLQEARMLLNAFEIHRYMPRPDFFESPVELPRASSSGHPVEKNYFLFWDTEGRVYVHYELFPTRSFAQLNYDGRGLGELAADAAHADQTCMARYMPHVAANLEAIHQATNSLLITLCSRFDPGCVPNDENTFIMHIFHHKSYYSFHGMYEPYTILFKRSTPFAIHAISQRPFWVSGRQALTVFTDAAQYRGKPEEIPEGHSEMFYITSMSWKSHQQKYHGYVDDVLFVAFGVEDTRAGVIDVKAEDLLQDLAFCDP
jgi:hypothetical protein